MTQLYSITFWIDREDFVDMGRVVVQGDEPEDAIKRVMFYCDIDASLSPKFDVSKLKPQFFQIERNEVAKHKKAGNGKADKGGFRKTYFISVNCDVTAGSEVGAAKKLGHYLTMKAGNASFDDKTIREFSLTLDKKTDYGNELKQPHISKQSIYKHYTVFQGGAARPR